MPQEAWEAAPIVEPPETPWEEAPLFEERGPKPERIIVEGVYPSGKRWLQNMEPYGDYMGRVADWAGVSLAGGPAEVREKAVRSTVGDPEDYSRLLTQHFGKKVEAYIHPDMDEMVYDDPVTGETTLIDEPSVGWADVAEAVSSTPVVAAEIVGGALGAPAGPLGVGVGSGAGAALARWTQLQAGRVAGENDYSNGKILGAAAFEGAIGLAGGLAGEALTAGVRRLFGTPQAKRFINDLTPEDMTDLTAYMDKIAAKVEKETGVRPQFNMSQVLRDAGAPDDVIKTMSKYEETLKMAEGGEVLKEAAKTVTAAERAMERKILTEAIDEPMGGIKSAKLGETIQDIAEQRVESLKAAAEEEMFAITEEALGKLDALMGPAGRTVEAGEAIGQVVEEGYRKSRNALSGRYEAFWQPYEGLTVSIEPVRKIAGKWENFVKGDIVKKLTEEDQSLMAGIAREGLAKIDGDSVVDSPVAMPYVNRALSTLKDLSREIKTTGKSTEGFREIKAISELIKSLQQVRDEALASVNPAAAQELKAIDSVWGDLSGRIENSFLNRIIKSNVKGGFDVPDMTAIEGIFKSPKQARNVRALVDNPEMEGFGSLSAFKDGLRALYRDKIAGGMTHSTFMRQYKAGMKEVFSPEEMKRFDSGSKAAHYLKMAETREKNIVSDLAKSFDYKLQRFDPEDVVDKVAGSLTKTREMMNILKGSPEHLEMFKAFRLKKLHDDILSPGDIPGRNEIDVTKLAKQLSQNKDELKSLYGDQWFENAQMFARLRNLTKPPQGVPDAAFKQLMAETRADAPMMVWRAMVARPLSRMGLLTTSALKIDSKRARIATAKLLADPKKMNEAMNLYRKGGSTRKWVDFLTTMGLIEVAEDMTE